MVLQTQNHEETFGKTLLMRMSLHVRQIQMASTDQFDWIFSAWIRGKTKRCGERAKVEQREGLPVNTCVFTPNNHGTSKNECSVPIDQSFWDTWRTLSSSLVHVFFFVAGRAMTVTNLSPETLYADLRMSQPTAKRGTYGRSLPDWHIWLPRVARKLGNFSWGQLQWQAWELEWQPLGEVHRTNFVHLAPACTFIFCLWGES